MLRLSLSLLAVGILGLAGCGGGGTTAAKRAAVSGDVSVDGKPMAGGEIRFTAAGQPAQVIEVRDGKFAGEAFVGKNKIEVIWEKDGPKHPMDPNIKLKVNVISPMYSGPNSSLSADVEAAGKSGLRFEVTTVK